MNKLVVRQTYINGTAFDTSNNRNHGIPYAVTQSTGGFAPAFTFRSPDSRVVVRPSASLQDLIAVRAIVDFYLDPAGGTLTRRYNLIEGELSFALFVNPDASLQGTILDANSQWNGAHSAANLVQRGRWHQAELRHDGINQCLLFLDGVQVGVGYAAPGQVRSVGANGIAVGHWPEPSGVYTMDGYIRGIEVYKFDPTDTAKNMLDSCCIKRDSLDALADQLRKKGYTAENAAQQGMELLKFGLDMSGAVRGNDPAASQQQALLSEQALAAFMGQNSAAYADALGRLAALTTQRLSQAQLQTLRDREEALIKQLPLPIKDWQKLIEDMCWARTKADPQAIATAFETATKIQSKQR